MYYLRCTSFALMCRLMCTSRRLHSSTLVNVLKIQFLSISKAFIDVYFWFSESWTCFRCDNSSEHVIWHKISFNKWFSFTQYGEIEDCQIDDSSLHAVITFKTRAEAEAAAVHGARFKGQDLKLAWNKPITNISAVETEEVEPDEEEVCLFFF